MRTPPGWTLFVLGCLAGLIAGWVSGGVRKTRFRLFNKPKKTSLPVLVPPGPAPRLIPNDSPNATRPQRTRAPLGHPMPAGATHFDYIAVFAESGQGSEADRVDYLLVPDDE
jgi:hypothetical protein